MINYYLIYDDNQTFPIDKITHYTYSFLKKKCNVKILNIKESYNYHFSKNDVIVLIYPIIQYTYSSRMLEFLKHHSQDQKIKVYAISITDLYESEVCEFSCRSLKLWCEKYHYDYKGQLMVGSILELSHKPTKFVMINYLKKFVESMKNLEECEFSSTMYSFFKFLMHSNKRVYKNLRKKNKKGA